MMSENDDSRTFTVRVETVEQARKRMRQAARSIDDGRTPDEQYGLSLPSEDRLNQVLSETNIALLRRVAREEPSSINETARLAGRDVHAVHDDLTQLADLGLVRFEQEGNAKRPVVPYDDIEGTSPFEIPTTRRRLENRVPDPRLRTRTPQALTPTAPNPDA